MPNNISEHQKKQAALYICNALSITAKRKLEQNLKKDSELLGYDKKKKDFSKEKGWSSSIGFFTETQLKEYFLNNKQQYPYMINNTGAKPNTTGKLSGE